MSDGFPSLTAKRTSRFFSASNVHRLRPSRVTEAAAGESGSRPHSLAVSSPYR